MSLYDELQNAKRVFEIFVVGYVTVLQSGMISDDLQKDSESEQDVGSNILERN